MLVFNNDVKSKMCKKAFLRVSIGIEKTSLKILILN